MRNWLLGLTATAIGGAAAGQSPPAGTVPPPVATYPGSGVTYPAVPPPSSFMPNIYDRATQPLSPYMGLLLGQNPAVDYYFGVRPGLRASSRTYGAGFGVPTGFGGGSRIGYLPLQAATAEQGVEIPAAGVPLPRNELFQTGHPVTFGVGPGRLSPGTGAGRPGFTRTPVPAPRRSSVRR
ncbi:MAG TPA: hypothetical protein VFG68_09760 [Fimbriiglobus sp.]|nr:hypothetical protein [Fimbriiglobus sp.]